MHAKGRRPYVIKASSAPSTEWPVLEEGAPSEAAASSPPASDTSPAVDQSSLAAPRGLNYAVDIVFCIDVTGSMTPIIDQVKENALRFYDDVQSNLTAKGKNVDQLRVRVIGFATLRLTVLLPWTSHHSSLCPMNGLTSPRS
jgi:hypothetical protein